MKCLFGRSDKELIMLYVCVLSHSVLSNSATSWTVASQTPLSMGILQARTLEWVAIPSSRDHPNPGIKPESPALTGRFFTTEPPGKLHSNVDWVPNAEGEGIVSHDAREGLVR